MPCSCQLHRITVHCFISHRIATHHLVVCGGLYRSAWEGYQCSRGLQGSLGHLHHASLGPVRQVGCVAKWEGNRNAPHTTRWEKMRASVWGSHILLTKSLAHGGLMTLSRFWLSAQPCHTCHVRHSSSTIWQGGWAHKILHVFPLTYSMSVNLFVPTHPPRVARCHLSVGSGQA